MSIFVSLLLVLLWHQQFSHAMSPQSSSPESNDEGIDLSLRLGPSPKSKKVSSEETVQQAISPNPQPNANQQVELHSPPKWDKVTRAQYQREYRIMLKKVDKERLQGYDKRKNVRSREKYEKLDERTKAQIKQRNNELNRQSYHLRKLRSGKTTRQGKFILQLQQKAADKTATPEELAFLHQLNQATQRSKARKPGQR
ncbi:uncharacterized protein FA14DRAFT_185914 [Meira miltonrushii]|uniref:BZIP domain-containing protein n=1 Tax=Meira miltonrushii TaxID=1280837 RepID=A0A316V6B0_9BASI|nr:uncharacterized protein FA14DRAFT_185914 [Meira miltonrushii]PWN32011.1 hypothetical protein FA14DRAFT_185914 [Meira miltonrushii]